MTTIRRTRFDDDISALGNQAVESMILPKLGPEDRGKYIAVDVDTGEFEIDKDVYTAATRMSERKPNARIWLARAGYPTTCRIGRIITGSS